MGNYTRGGYVNQSHAEAMGAKLFGHLERDESRTAYAVVLQGDSGPSLAPLCKTPECALEAVAVFEGAQVLGLATIAVEAEPVSGMQYRLRSGSAPAGEQASGQVVWPSGVINRDKTLEVLTQHNAWRRGAEGPQTDPRLLGLALDAAIAFLSAPAVAVAFVGGDFTLHWAGSGPIAPIVERHGIKVGSPLFATPQPAAGAVPEAVVGTVTRVGEFEVLEHQITLEPEFDERLNRMPARTTIKLYAAPVRDLTQQQLRDAAAMLAAAQKEADRG